MQRIVVYFMTRNIYRNVLPSLKSLLRNGNVDQVILMTEDDDVGYELPEKVSVMNVTPWKSRLDPDGPNYGCRWTYMVMMKCLLSSILSECQRVVSLDLDTIVVGDISELWKINLDGAYLAGAREWYWSSKNGRDCINAGVLVWNLDMMRDGMEDRLIGALNTKQYRFPEQDAISEICTGKIRILNSAYNYSDWTDKPVGDVKIIHFAGYKERFNQQPIVQAYRDMGWEAVLNER